MKDPGQQARASENFSGPVDFETPNLIFFSRLLYCPFLFEERGPCQAIDNNGMNITKRKKYKHKLKIPANV